MNLILTICSYLFLLVPVLTLAGLVWFYQILFGQPLYLVLLGFGMAGYPIVGWWLTKLLTSKFTREVMTSKGLQRRWRQQDVSGGVYGIKFVLGFSLVMVPLGLYVALFGLFLLVRGHVFGLTMPLTAGAITWNASPEKTEVGTVASQNSKIFLMGCGVVG